MNEFIRGAMTQSRVVFALALRETRTRFGAHRLGYIWALLEPIFWIATFGSVFLVAGRESTDGMEVIPFLATGVIPYELAVKTADRVSQSIEGNRALLFYPQVQPIDLVFARGVLELATAIVVFAVIIGSYSVYMQRFSVDSFLGVLVGFGLATLFGMAWGLVMLAGTVVNNSIQRIKSPIMRPLFWISGLFYSANSLPSEVREYFLWNPILHCVEIVRGGWFPGYHARYASTSFVLVCTLVLAFVGLTLERRVRPKIQLS